MRADVYQAMAKAEDTHWWFRARRTILTDILKRLSLPKNATILDAGSGTGGNLSMLSGFGRVYGMEMDREARILANKRSIVEVQEGALPGPIPFDNQLFDLIAMFDVLEHVEQDYSTLTALRDRLTPQGILLLTVPAFEFLWSRHDVIHHHKRRYSLSPLLRMLDRAGYKVTFASYINFWLFPLIALARIVDRLSGGKVVGSAAESEGNAELFIPPVPLNNLLEKIFASESRLIKFMRLPFGVSIVLTAQKA